MARIKQLLIPTNATVMADHLRLVVRGFWLCSVETEICRPIALPEGASMTTRISPGCFEVARAELKKPEVSGRLTPKILEGAATSKTSGSATDVEAPTLVPVAAGDSVNDATLIGQAEIRPGKMTGMNPRQTATQRSVTLVTTNCSARSLVAGWEWSTRLVRRI